MPEIMVEFAERVLILIMLVANLSRNIVQEARRFALENQSRTRQVRLEPGREEAASAIVSEPDRVAPRFTPIDNTQRMQIENHLRDARDLANEFYSLQKTEQVWPSRTLSGDSEISRPTPSTSSGHQFTRNLRQIASITSERRQSYATSDPDPLVITTGIQENGLTLDKIL